MCQQQQQQQHIYLLKICTLRITHFSKHPFLVETVDEEDGGLCESHEEVTERQIHNEVVWQAAQLLVTARTHKERM